MTGSASGLEGRVCVVTGGGSGIGRAIATTLAGAGAAVAVLDRNRDAAEATLALAAGAGGTGLALECDVSESDSIEAACATVSARLGDAHVLVNNAAIIRPGALDTLSLADWNELIAVNLTGYFLCSQAFGRAMRARGEGVLVHTSSVAATMPTPFAGAYSVAKAGVTMLSRLLALEWGPNGIRSNAVCPGMVRTPLVRQVYEQPGATEARGGMVPSRRVGEPVDIAGAVLFLASPAAAYVNGTELTVDGGFQHNFMSQIPRAGFEPTPKPM